MWEASPTAISFGIDSLIGLAEIVPQEPFNKAKLLLKLPSPAGRGQFAWNSLWRPESPRTGFRHLVLARSGLSRGRTSTVSRIAGPRQPATIGLRTGC